MGEPATSDGRTRLDLAQEAAVGALDQPGRPGLMDERVWQQRVDRYLAFATPSVNVGSATGLAVQLIASHRDPRYRWPIERATVEALNSTWQ